MISAKVGWPAAIAPTSDIASSAVATKETRQEGAGDRVKAVGVTPPAGVAPERSTRGTLGDTAVAPPPPPTKPGTTDNALACPPPHPPRGSQHTAITRGDNT